MPDSFRTKLEKLYGDDSGRFGKKHFEKEYQTMIRYGALGQLAENHYLYLYRDIYRNAAYYGAVIFFNRPDELGNPVRVTCIEQDGSQRKRDIYIKAALYFITRDCKNTMDLAGTVETVFDMAKEKIDAFIDSPSNQRENATDFAYDLNHRPITAVEIPSQKQERIFKDHLLDKNLKKLSKKPLVPNAGGAKGTAVPGFNLEVGFLDLSGVRTFYFKPLIIPLKKDGSPLRPKKFDVNLAKNYDFNFEAIPPVLIDFFKIFLPHFENLDMKDKDASIYKPVKYKIIDQLFFLDAARAVFSLPTGRLFCRRAGKDKDYQPLKTVTFDKIAARFAPSLEKEHIFHIYLQFLTPASQPIDARGNYDIRIIGNQVYIFLEEAGGECYFAIPSGAEGAQDAAAAGSPRGEAAGPVPAALPAPLPFLSLFDFLSAQRDFPLTGFDRVEAALKAAGSSSIQVQPGLLKKYRFTLLPTPILKIGNNINRGPRSGRGRAAAVDDSGNDNENGLLFLLGKTLPAKDEDENGSAAGAADSSENENGSENEEENGYGYGYEYGDGDGDGYGDSDGDSPGMAYLLGNQAAGPGETIEDDQERERLEIDFDYEGEIKKYIAHNPDKEVYTYTRDEEFEKACSRLLKSDSLLKQETGRNEVTQRPYLYYSFRDCTSLDWLVQHGKLYLEKGFKIYSTKWKRYIGNTSGTIHVKIAADTDWLEFKPLVSAEGIAGEGGNKIVDIDIEQNTVTDDKGMLHLVSRAEIEKLAHLYKYKEKYGSIFRVPSRNFFLVQELYDKRMESIPSLKEILETRQQLEHFEKIPDYKLSPNFKGTLRQYQEDGFKWLSFLEEYRFSGCLADDMGLGKTVQTLALLQTLKDNKKLKTSLLVVPVSAISNWEMEIERFTPGLRTYRHQGIKREKNSASWGKYDLVITSYATMRNDIEIFKDFPFDYLVLDEAQNIKNLASQVAKAAKLLQAEHRLALSGTPIENNTMELWSLFDFLIPGFLGTHRWFKNHFAGPVERDGDNEKKESLKKMIYPFVLRRKKADVEQDLPEKTEILSKLSMEEEQARLYAGIAARYKQEVQQQIDRDGIGKAAVQIFEKMMRLRQLCLFPSLVSEEYEPVPSAKFNHLLELLEDIIGGDHKVLVFSQFVQVLKIIRGHLDREKIGYAYIDGSLDVGSREKEVKKFQENEDTRVFLLSLKAGGVALNLTAADYVVIFDPWWNPAVEAQAIDRSHRIGQVRPVMVYRMVLEHSIEEKMLKLQDRKKALVEDLITTDGGGFKDLDKEDILDLFNF